MSDLLFILIKILFHFQGITKPSEPFFWPEALLPKSSREKELPIDEPLDRLQPGYSGYVDDTLSDDDDLDDGNEDDHSLDSCTLTVSNVPYFFSYKKFLSHLRSRSETYVLLFRRCRRRLQKLFCV